MLGHVSLGVSSIERARAFYDPVMGALGARQLLSEGAVVAYGRRLPELWIGVPSDGGAPSPGHGIHVCLTARTKQEVDDFHAAALVHGGQDDGRPGLRPEYLPNYYAAFVLDPDGNRLEALRYLTDGR